MTNEMHVAITNFRTALTKFWKDYVSLPTPSKAFDLNYAKAFHDERGAVLAKVLDMRRHARDIARNLNSPVLKALNEKES